MSLLRKIKKNSESDHLSNHIILGSIILVHFSWGKRIVLFLIVMIKTIRPRYSHEAIPRNLLLQKSNLPKNQQHETGKLLANQQPKVHGFQTRDKHVARVVTTHLPSTASCSNNKMLPRDLQFISTAGLLFFFSLACVIQHQQTVISSRASSMPWVAVSNLDQDSRSRPQICFHRYSHHKRPEPVIEENTQVNYLLH